MKSNHQIHQMLRRRMIPKVHKAKFFILLYSSSNMEFNYELHCILYMTFVSFTPVG